MQKEVIRVLVCDDSVFIRRAITRMLSVPGIEVIDTASNGQEAFEKAVTLQPDLITLDFEMPVMNGLEALKLIMEKNPLPVMMFSTHTKDKAHITLEALSIGAVDFMTKSQSMTGVFTLKQELLNKVFAIGSNKELKKRLQQRNSSANQSSLTENIEQADKNERLAFTISQKLQEAKKKKFVPKQTATSERPNPNNIKIIGIGISTGGPVALMELLPKLPSDLPVPILIAQHMPPVFTRSLAERLNSKSKLHVKEAEDGDRLQPGYVYIAPGGRQMSVTRRFKISIGDDPADELYKPSANILFNSIADVFYEECVGLIMTGMGHDGLEGLKKINSLGGYIIAQEIESCVVPGMPKSVIDVGIADEIYPLLELAEALASLFSLTTN